MTKKGSRAAKTQHRIPVSALVHPPDGWHKRTGARHRAPVHPCHEKSRHNADLVNELDVSFSTPPMVRASTVALRTIFLGAMRSLCSRQCARNLKGSAGTNCPRPRRKELACYSGRVALAWNPARNSAFPNPLRKKGWTPARLLRGEQQHATRVQPKALGPLTQRIHLPGLSDCNSARTQRSLCYILSPHSSTMTSNPP